MRAGREDARLTAAVLQLAPQLDRYGIGRDAVDLARHLRARGWRALVASPGGQLERELAAAGGTHLPLPLDADGRFATWRNRGRLARIIRAHRVSLVHAHGPLPTASGAAAAHAAAIPFVATVHDADESSWRSGADRLIAVSDFLAEGLTRQHAVTPERLRVVRRWIDPDEFDPERVRGHRVLALAERWASATAHKVVLVPPLHAGRSRPSAAAAGPGAPAAHRLRGLFAAGRDRRRLWRGDRDGRAQGRAWASASGSVATVDDLPAALSLADRGRPARDPARPVRHPGRGGAGDGQAGDRHQPRRLGRGGDARRHGLAGAAGRPGELARALDLALSLDDETRGAPGRPRPRLRQAPSSAWSRCASVRSPSIAS